MSKYVIEAQRKDGSVGIFKGIVKRNGIAKISLAVLDQKNVKEFPSKERASRRIDKLRTKFGDEYQFNAMPWPRLTVFGGDEEEKEKFNVDGKWICGKDAATETWHACEYFEFKYRAIQAAKNQVNLHNKGKRRQKFEDILGYYPDDKDTIISFAIGQCAVPVISIDANDIFERVAEDVYEQCGEVAEDYLDDVLDEHKKELEEIIFKWFEKYDYLPSCYSISNIETIEI